MELEVLVQMGTLWYHVEDDAICGWFEIEGTVSFAKTVLELVGNSQLLYCGPCEQMVCTELVTLTC